MREWPRFAKRLRRGSRECESDCASRSGFDAGRTNARVTALREAASTRVARMREWLRFAKRLRRGREHAARDA